MREEKKEWNITHHNNIPANNDTEVSMKGISTVQFKQLKKRLHCKTDSMFCAVKKNGCYTNIGLKEINLWAKKVVGHSLKLPVINRHIFTFSHLIISYPDLSYQRTVSSSVLSPIILLFITKAVLMLDTCQTHG